MASKIKESVLKEIRELANRYEKDNTKRVLLNNLYTQIKKYDDDKDIVNSVWANKDLPLRMFTEPELKKMPSLNALLIGEPYKDKVDKDKYFGKDWYKDITKIPYNKIALVAAKEGRSPQTLMKEMSDEAIAKTRYDVAHEGVLGTVMPFVAKRTQEAIERGEEPTGYDYGLDFLQTGLESSPYGRIGARIGNKAGRFIISRLLSNATAPLATEAADAAVYDSTNAAGRGDFNVQDVVGGTGVNAMGEGFLRMGGGFLNRLGSEKVGKRLMNLGEGETLTQSLAKDIDAASKAEAANELLMKRNAKGEALSTHNAGSNKERLDAINYEKNRDAMETRKNILEEIDFNYNNNKARDMVYGKNNHPILPSNYADFADNYYPEGMGALTDEQLRFMQNDPVLQKYIDVDKFIWPTEKRYMVEEGVKNLITNKLGSYQQEQGRGFTRIPFGIGAKLQGYFDEKKEEEEKRKEEERVLNEYRLNLLGGFR